MTCLVLVRHAHVHGITPPAFRGQQELDLSEGIGQLSRLGSASVSVLELKSDAVSLLQLNDTAHLHATNSIPSIP